MTAARFHTVVRESLRRRLIPHRLPRRYELILKFNDAAATPQSSLECPTDLNGLMRKSSAPASRPWRRSPFSPYLEVKTKV